MDFTIASILGLDGITNGAIYALVAIALVLVFAVTRIVFIPQGEYVAFGALTMALLQTGQVPGTVWLLLLMAAAAALMDGAQARRERWPAARRAPWRCARWPCRWAPRCSTIWLAPTKPPLLVQAALTLALVTPMGPLVYRLAYRSLADASVLVLLIVSVGRALRAHRPGPAVLRRRGLPQSAASGTQRFTLGPLGLTGQTLIIFAASVALIVALFVFFERTLSGKALRATSVNRTGARLMGIAPTAPAR